MLSTVSHDDEVIFLLVDADAVLRTFPDLEEAVERANNFSGKDQVEVARR